jgi:hypothetical protein
MSLRWMWRSDESLKQAKGILEDESNEPMGVLLVL